jgi:hypothetical protein
MIKATPEFEAKIKASGVPIIEITLEQLKQVVVVKNFKPKRDIKNNIK